ncbi:MAG: hypothetical protein V1810_03465 [Candidatus Beckwithbacteria bacterium]
MSLANPIVTGILGAIGGVAFTLITKFGEGWIKEFFEKRKQKQLKKKQAAKDINAFCVEGMHKFFRIRAGSEQHIKFRATEIEAIDLETGIKLRQFIDAWSQHRNINKRNLLTLEDEKIAKDYRDKAQQLGEELLKVARLWGK